MVFDTYFGNPEINHYPLEQVNTPTLVISAVDDPAALHENARTLAARIPYARLVAVPDGGHLMLGHTQEVKQEITQFLRDNVLELKTMSNNTQQLLVLLNYQGLFSKGENIMKILLGVLLIIHGFIVTAQTYV